VSARILIVEDDAGLRMTLGDRLRREGHDVVLAVSGEAGLELGRSGRFDCIVLDVGLPKRDGFSVCCELREARVEAPILMLTARGEIADKVAGLRLGADDYLTKPFQMVELLARIEACLRRSARAERGAGGAAEIVIGAARVDLRRMVVERDGREVALTATESRLLRYFLEHRGAVVSRAELLDVVWGAAEITTRTVDVHVAALRRAIEPGRAPRFLVTVHGVGYQLL